MSLGGAIEWSTGMAWALPVANARASAAAANIFDRITVSVTSAIGGLSHNAPTPLKVLLLAAAGFELSRRVLAFTDRLPFAEFGRCCEIARVHPGWPRRIGRSGYLFRIIYCSRHLMR